MFKAGKLRYQVRLDDGRLWERHVDHIVGVGECLMPRVASGAIPEPSILLPTVPVFTRTTSKPLLIATDTASAAVEDTSITNRPNITAETSSTSITEQPGRLDVARKSEGQPLRRSTRIIRAPQKLNL